MLGAKIFGEDLDLLGGLQTVWSDHSVSALLPPGGHELVSDATPVFSHIGVDGAADAGRGPR